MKMPNILVDKNWLKDDETKLSEKMHKGDDQIHSGGIGKNFTKRTQFKGNLIEPRGKHLHKRRFLQRNMY